MKLGRLVAGAREAAVLVCDEGRVWLRRLFGLTCSNCGKDDGPIPSQGLAVLSTNLGRFEGPALRAQLCEFSGSSARIRWLTADGALALESIWMLSPSGVLSRKDVLTNTSTSPLTVYRVQARYTFSPGRYEISGQSSSWARENDPFDAHLSAGALVFRCEGGRTTQGGTPYARLREELSGRGVVFHVAPKGNWVIRFTARSSFDGLPYMVVELGLADEELTLTLPPGQTLELPEILVQGFEGAGGSVAAELHRHTLESLESRWGSPPVVYNTWFDRFDELEPERLRRQLRVAKEIGCEVFVVDAGWYGAGLPWWKQVGDWRERQDGAFRGGMTEFAEEVRREGLGFGLWMEPERFFEGVPILRERPEWFAFGSNGAWRIRMEREDARAYLREQIERLIETYRLAWMKIDFNFELGHDDTGAEFLRYYEAWYEMLDELRRSHPDTFFEGCSSGGMRLDLEALRHFDAHFLSDTVDPVDMIRIGEGALLRLPPGWLTRWAVVYPLGPDTVTKGVSQSQVLTPCRAGRERLQTADVGFLVCAALPGVFGLSGDLAGLHPETRVLLAKGVAFYKRWRAELRKAVGRLLTPPRPRGDRQGWSALQLLNERSGAAFLFAYRLDDVRDRMRFHLEGLDSTLNYRLEWFGVGDASDQEERPGDELIREGVEVRLCDRFRACALVLLPQGGAPHG